VLTCYVAMVLNGLSDYLIVAKKALYKQMGEAEPAKLKP